MHILTARLSALAVRKIVEDCPYVENSNDVNKPMHINYNAIDILN